MLSVGFGLSCTVGARLWERGVFVQCLRPNCVLFFLEAFLGEGETQDVPCSCHRSSARCACGASTPFSRGRGFHGMRRDVDSGNKCARSTPVVHYFHRRGEGMGTGEEEAQQKHRHKGASLLECACSTRCQASPSLACRPRRIRCDKPQERGPGGVWCQAQAPEAAPRPWARGVREQLPVQGPSKGVQLRRSDQASTSPYQRQSRPRDV